MNLYVVNKNLLTLETIIDEELYKYIHIHAKLSSNVNKTNFVLFYAVQRKLNRSINPMLLTYKPTKQVIK